MTNLIALLENVIDNLEYCANYSDAAIVNKQEIILNQCRKLAEAAQELREAEPVGYVYACGQVSFPATLYQSDDLPDDLKGGLIEAIPLYRHPTRK